ncbi:hypothetical protein F2Q69_00019079 [Brassica cretica]|uniref:U-box domain-containing protein n=1 Tax=Brassica cretica TaxID=69181 RepID=A0A8S9Q4K0_BRACR|nr:hypothetical protein F2Q69_00019079 [Brassica cretica]
MSQRLSLPCRLVKDGPSDNVQVHLNQMDARAKSGSTVGLRMSSWSGKTSSGTVSSVAEAPIGTHAGRLSQSDRLVKDGPSDNVQVHLNQMDARGKDKDSCGTVRMNVELVGEDELRYGQFGHLVVVPAEAPIGTHAGWLGQSDRYGRVNEPRLNCSERPDLHAGVVAPCMSPGHAEGHVKHEFFGQLTAPRGCSVRVEISQVKIRSVQDQSRRGILIVPLLVKKILRVSDLATQCSVSILWKLWRKNGEDHALLEALQVGAFEKLVVVLQVGCEEKTKERASELLRNLNRCRNEIEKTNCLDSSMRLKNVKKSF